MTIIEKIKEDVKKKYNRGDNHCSFTLDWERYDKIHEAVLSQVDGAKFVDVVRYIFDLGFPVFLEELKKEDNHELN